MSAVDKVNAALDFAKKLIAPERPAFEFRAGPFLRSELRVESLTGHEGVSELYSFAITAVTRFSPELVIPATLGQSACLTLWSKDLLPRPIVGMVSRVAVLGRLVPDDLVRYSFELVPRLWTLKRKRNSRIFQDQKATAIVLSILQEAGVHAKSEVTRDVRTREYCVQYMETDLHFIQRILAEEGIFFYFHHPAAALDVISAGLASAASGVLKEAPGLLAAAGEVLGGDAGAAIGAFSGKLSGLGQTLGDLELLETMVLADSASYPHLAGRAVGDVRASVQLSPTGSIHPDFEMSDVPTLTFGDEEGIVAMDDKATSFALERRFRPKAVTVRHHSFEHPQFEPTGSAQHKRFEVTRSFSLALDSAIASGVDASFGVNVEHAAIGHDPRAHEQYFHDDVDYADASNDRAKRMLESLRRNVIRGEGSSRSRRLAAGHTFALDGHSIDRMNGEWVVTRISHKGHVPEGRSEEAIRPIYENHFSCVPADVVYRPRLPKRRTQQAVEPAIVVGPPNEEIHCDALGRIRIQFYWDRKGGRNERSTCWVRVKQPWTGAHAGFQFIPRVGSEVLVTFAFGDADRPIVIGNLWDGKNQPPYSLPEHKTRSGVRTRTTPNGGGYEGYNEIAFEDAKGRERLTLRSENTLAAEAVKLFEVRVGHKGGSNPTGEGYYSVNVATDRTAHVGRSDFVRVGKDRVVEVVGKSNQLLLGESFTTVHGTWREVALGARYSHVHTSDVRTVDGDLMSSVGGTMDVSVSGPYRALLQSHAHLLVADSLDLSLGSTISVASTKGAMIESGGGIRLVCGQSVIELLPDQILLESPTIRIKGEQAIVSEIPDVTLALGKQGVSLATKGTLDVRADKEVALSSNKAGLKLSAADGGAIAASANAISLAAKSSSIALDEHATIAGSQVHLNPSSADSGDGGLESEFDPLATSWVELELVDQDDNPIAGARYIVVAADGTEVRGVLDGTGFARVPVRPGAATVDFLDYDQAAWAKA